MQKLALIASGMVTSVGLNAPASCAAIRCKIDNNQETRFISKGGEWIIGAMVPLEKPWRGLAKMEHLVVPAIRECLDAVENIPAEKIPLYLCVAEKDRPGRLEGLDDLLLNNVMEKLGRFHEKSAVIAEGRVGGALAISQAADMLYREHLPYCIIAGVDTFLVAGTLRAYEKKMRLLTAENSNGIIPGEAGAAILVGAAHSVAIGNNLLLQGSGFGQENATIESEEPLRADGLVQAINLALSSAGLASGDIDLRILDANGEQYIFKEAALAKIRIFREPKEEFDIWHPAESTGEVGAATVPITLGVTLAAIQKNYVSGQNILCHFGSDDGKRAAIIVCSS